METAIIYQQFNLNKVSHITAYADLGLHQSEAVRCSKPGKKAINRNTPLIAKQNDLESYFIENIYDRFAQHKSKNLLYIIRVIIFEFQPRQFWRMSSPTYSFWTKMCL